MGGASPVQGVLSRPKKEINLITANDAFIDHKAWRVSSSKSEDLNKSFPLLPVWSVLNMIEEGVKIFDEFVCCTARCEM